MSVRTVGLGNGTGSHSLPRSVGTPPPVSGPLNGDADSASAPNPVSVLQEAEGLINGHRADDYGNVLESFTRIGRLWAPLLGLEDVTAEQVALCMTALKLSRATNGYHRDSVVDIAGYAGCLEKIKKLRESA